MKLNKQDKMLIEEAKKIIIKSKPVKLIDTGEAGAALLTSKRNIFRGVNVGFYCGIGSCGEYQAIGNMISNGEKEIEKIVAVYYDEANKKYNIIPPFVKCSEMMHQLGKKNWNTEVIVSNEKKVKLNKLLPYAWGGTIEK